jgi:hypothetical protein
MIPTGASSTGAYILYSARLGDSGLRKSVGAPAGEFTPTGRVQISVERLSLGGFVIGVLRVAPSQGAHHSGVGSGGHALGSSFELILIPLPIKNNELMDLHRRRGATSSGVTFFSTFILAGAPAPGSRGRL